MREAIRHPQNADGDFFVENYMCTACDAPRSEAPELIDYDAENHCYFARQPANETELEHAISAVRVSCVEAVQYGGCDQAIIDRIRLQPPTQDNSFDERTSFPDKLLASLKKFLGH